MSHLWLALIIVVPLIALGFLIYINRFTRRKLHELDESRREYITYQSEKGIRDYLCTKREGDLLHDRKDFTRNGDR